MPASAQAQPPPSSWSCHLSASLFQPAWDGCSVVCAHVACPAPLCCPQGAKSFFTEIITSINDIKFSRDGRYILSRDYMTLKLWDVNMENAPVAVYPVQEALRSKVGGQMGGRVGLGRAATAWCSRSGGGACVVFVVQVLDVPAWSTSPLAGCSGRLAGVLGPSPEDACC